ncbi:MAG: hypothetical protein WCJ60_02465 [bacterium]
MAEGYSHNPDDENTIPSIESTVNKKPEAVDRFRAFISEIFRPKDSKDKYEQEEDEEDKESSSKINRFTKLWRSLFSSLAIKEDVIGDSPERPRRGLFFEATDTEGVLEEPETPDEPEVIVPESVTPSEIIASIPEVEVSKNTVEYTEPAIKTVHESVVVGGLTSSERFRVRNLESNLKNTERELNKVQKNQERVREMYNRSPEAKKPESVNHYIKPEVKVEQPRSPEQIVSVNEVAKKTIIENILKIDNKEQEVQKEISYELSHEHKDMDKQTAGAWAALQERADNQAKSNAAAVAAAQNIAQDADLLKKDLAKDVKNNQNSLYKKATISGFVTAVIVFAIILTIILVQSK